MAVALVAALHHTVKCVTDGSIWLWRRQIPWITDRGPVGYKLEKSKAETAIVKTE